MGGIIPRSLKNGGTRPPRSPPPPVAEPLLTKKDPKRQKGPQCVPMQKIANCLKNITISVKKAHFFKYRVSLGSSQWMKFLGTRGGPGPRGPSRPAVSPDSSPGHWRTQGAFRAMTLPIGIK